MGEKDTDNHSLMVADMLIEAMGLEAVDEPLLTYLRKKSATYYLTPVLLKENAHSEAEIERKEQEAYMFSIAVGFLRTVKELREAGFSIRKHTGD